MALSWCLCLVVQIMQRIRNAMRIAIMMMIKTAATPAAILSAIVMVPVSTIRSIGDMVSGGCVGELRMMSGEPLVELRSGELQVEL